MKKKVNRIAALLASAALLFGALSCSSDSGGGGNSDTVDNPGSSTPVAIVLTADPAAVTVGETITVKSNIEGVKFSSSDSTVATVEESTGVVKGVKAGNVTIIAKKDAASGKTYTSGKVEITVKEAAGSGDDVKVTSVTVSGDSTVKVGNTITLTATVAPENATDNTVTWSSSDTTIATVGESTGIVKGVKAGSVKITATAGGVTSDEYTVTVTASSAPEEEKVTIVMVEDGTAGSGEEKLLSELSSLVSDLPEGAVVYSDSSYTDVVSDVSSVKAGDTLYVVYITQNQYLNGKGNDLWNKVSYDFSKHSNISSISIALTRVKGTKTDASEGWWFCYGASAWIGKFDWSDSINGYSAIVTDAANIASIVENGLYVYGNVFGSGNIEVTVTEKVPVTSVTVSGDTTVKQGLTITLTAVVAPENATNNTVTWKSSNEEVATVDGGVVKGVKAGTAKITATADGVTSNEYEVTVEANNAKLKSITKKSDPEKLKYNVGDEINLAGLEFTLTYDDGENGNVAYSSSDDALFTVSGFNSGKAAESQTVTVTYINSGITGTATFTVKIVQPVTKVTVSGESTVEVAGKITLTAAVEPTDATDSSVTWSSSDQSVATVADGVVTGVAEGTAVITATANDGSKVEGSHTVTVTKQTGDFVITIE